MFYRLAYSQMFDYSLSFKMRTVCVYKFNLVYSVWMLPSFDFVQCYSLYCFVIIIENDEVKTKAVRFWSRWCDDIDQQSLEEHVYL